MALRLVALTLCLLVALPASARAADRTAEACPDANLTRTSFVDIDGSVHREAIECGVWWAVTSGRTVGRYAPDSRVTRGQMATFIARMLKRSEFPLLTGRVPDAFTDDDGTVHEASIDLLARYSVVRGVSATQFGAGQRVTRGQMATFLVRAAQLIMRRPTSENDLADGRDRFRDDDGSVHERAIDGIATQGIASGYPDGTYRPAAPVTRAQMAAFLTRLIGMLVADGHMRPLVAQLDPDLPAACLDAPGNRIGGKMSAGGSSVHFVGTDGPDILLGTVGVDWFHGNGGDDTICAGGGADVVLPGDGDDKAHLGSGNDSVYDWDGNGAGNDIIFGGAGAETVDAGSGHDRVYLGAGVLRRRDGLDWVHAGPGDDVVVANGVGYAWLLGEEGNDRLVALTPPADIAECTIEPVFGCDDLWGGDGTDLIFALDGNSDHFRLEDDHDSGVEVPFGDCTVTAGVSPDGTAEPDSRVSVACDLLDDVFTLEVDSEGRVSPELGGIGKLLHQTSELVGDMADFSEALDPLDPDFSEALDGALDPTETGWVPPSEDVCICDPEFTVKGITFGDRNPSAEITGVSGNVAARTRGEH